MLLRSLGNVDERDHWKIHFRDTMRGSTILAARRMAAPELSGWERLRYPKNTVAAHTDPAIAEP
jgi:hypothetical protein